MPQPLELDVKKVPSEIPSYVKHSLQGTVSINMIHFTKWNCTKALFEESGKLLKEGHFLKVYGPFKIGNKYTSQSNFFDNSLKMKNDYWGISNLEEVSCEGKKNGFSQEDIILCRQIIFQ